MATISTIQIAIRGDNSHAAKAMREVSSHAETMGKHVEGIGAGSSRSFKFLGKEIKEMGEGLGGANSQLGEMAGSLGGITQGVGEAIHGYHALHGVIHLATAAQAALNAITPTGWVLIAGGAIAAGAAYLTFSHHVETAEEKTKRLKEALGDVANLSGVAFERKAAEKIKELKKSLQEAEEDHKWRYIGAAAGGPAGAAVGYQYEQYAIEGAKKKLDEFNEAIIAHKRELAGKQADSALDHVLETASKLNKTPLTQFREELKASGRQANECAEAITRFKVATEKISFSKVQDELTDLRKEIENAGKSKEALLAERANREGDRTGDSRYRKIAEQARELDRYKQWIEEHGKETEKLHQHEEQLASKAKSLTDSVSPFSKWRGECKELDEMMRKNLISLSVYQQAGIKARQQLMQSFLSEAPKTMTGYLEYGSSQAANEIAREKELQQQEQWALQQIAALQQQNDLTKESNDLLGKMIGELAKGITMDF